VREVTAFPTVVKAEELRRQGAEVDGAGRR
jgi:hypothetical protein